MFQWTEKFQPQQDYITILILLVFVLFVYLYRRNQHQFKLLASFWRTKIYFNIYIKEKMVNPFNSFNMILTLISLFTFSLLISLFYNNILMSSYGEISFFTFFVILTSLVIFRYGLLQLIFRLINQSKLYHQTVVMSQGYYGIISLFSLSLISIYYYCFFYNVDLLFFVIILILGGIFLSHMSIYLRIIKEHPVKVIYLILYLCAFKIVPWLWLYNLIY